MRFCWPALARREGREGLGRGETYSQRECDDRLLAVVMRVVRLRLQKRAVARPAARQTLIATPTATRWAEPDPAAGMAAFLLLFVFAAVAVGDGVPVSAT